MTSCLEYIAQLLITKWIFGIGVRALKHYKLSQPNRYHFSCDEMSSSCSRTYRLHYKRLNIIQYIYSEAFIWNPSFSIYYFPLCDRVICLHFVNKQWNWSDGARVLNIEYVILNASSVKNNVYSCPKNIGDNEWKMGEKSFGVFIL